MRNNLKQAFMDNLLSEREHKPMPLRKRLMYVYGCAMGILSFCIVAASCFVCTKWDVYKVILICLAFIIGMAACLLALETAKSIKSDTNGKEQ